MKCIFLHVVSAQDDRTALDLAKMGGKEDVVRLISVRTRV